MIMVAVLFLSCSTVDKIPYFQDIQEGEVANIVEPASVLVKPEDKISIVVNAKDVELANIFNLSIVGVRVGDIKGTAYAQGGLSSYTVDQNGNIDFPIIGEISVAGMTRSQIAAKIKSELIDKHYLKDVVVTVEFVNLAISVLGEVNMPGRYTIDRDRLTILDGISMAGDLTVLGERDNVLVIREVDGKKMVYRVNLNSAADMFSSPAYYLQQNDVIYVEPNPVKARQSTANGNQLLSSSFWVSVASLLTSVAVLIFK